MEIELYKLRMPQEITREATELYKDLEDIHYRINGIEHTPMEWRDQILIELYESRRDKSFLYKLLEAEFYHSMHPPEIMVTI